MFLFNLGHPGVDATNAYHLTSYYYLHLTSKSVMWIKKEFLIISQTFTFIHHVSVCVTSHSASWAPRLSLSFWIVFSDFRVILLEFHRLRLISLCCSSVFPLSLKHSILAPVSLSPLLNTLLWLVSSHKPEPELWKATEQLCQINSYMPNKLLGINCASLRCFGSSVSMKEKRFCWCRLWPF